MQGKVQGDTFIVLDSFALPVEGTETRVNAQARRQGQGRLGSCARTGARARARGCRVFRGLAGGEGGATARGGDQPRVRAGAQPRPQRARTARAPRRLVPSRVVTGAPLTKWPAGGGI